MKNLLIAVLLAVGLLVTSQVFAAAPDLSIGSATGGVGTTVQIPVMADLSIPIFSNEFTVTYDPALLTPTSVTAGSANSGWTVVDNPNTAGTLIIGMFSAAGTSISGNAQQIAVINFTVNAGPGTLASPNLTLSNAVFDDNTVTNFINGNFTLSLLGDVNGDGKVTLADAVLTAQAAVGITSLTPVQQTAAEVDGTGKVDIYDAALIAQYVAGVINKL